MFRPSDATAINVRQNTMQDPLDLLCELIELDQRLAAGLDTDESAVDESLARCVDLVMMHEDHWV